MALFAGLPGVMVALILLWTGSFTPKVQWTLTVFIVGVWTGCSFGVRRRVVLPLQTLSNLLAALRESDFSIRARTPGTAAASADPLGAVMFEVNVLASTLHDQRLGALEAGALLRTVMLEIDVAVFTLDEAQTLRLVNRAGERLLAQPADQLLGRTAADLGLDACLDGPSPRIADAAFAGEPFTIRIVAPALAGIKCSYEETGVMPIGSIPLRRADDALTATLAIRRPGLYTITARGGGYGPVRDDVLVVPPDD